MVHSKINSLSKYGIGILLVLCGLMGVVTSVAAQNITQGYTTDEPLQRGLIVALNKDNGQKVEAATKKSEKRIHGVVVNANDAPATLSADTSKVFVASTGQYEVLVSDQVGPVAVGDYIAISGLAGIGMKAEKQQKIVIGRALANFDGQTAVVGSQQFEEGTVKIGRILVEVGVARNPHAEPEDAGVPGFLKKAGESIAGRPISLPRLYGGIGIFVATIVITSSMLFAGARNSLTAVGRNPLSRGTIARQLLQVVIGSLIVFTIGLFAVYLLLKI